jgi:hypothetical protein
MDRHEYSANKKNARPFDHHRKPNDLFGQAIYKLRCDRRRFPNSDADNDPWGRVVLFDPVHLCPYALLSKCVRDRFALSSARYSAGSLQVLRERPVFRVVAHPYRLSSGWHRSQQWGQGSQPREGERSGVASLHALAFSTLCSALGLALLDANRKH